MNITGTYSTQHGDLMISQNGDMINATYQESGVCKGKLTGNKVEGTWINKEGEGLFEWTFNENGDFTGKYKSGMNSGPMKGKWNGSLITENSFNKRQEADEQTNRSLYEISQDYNNERIIEFSLLLKELVMENTFQGKEMPYEFNDLAEQVNRTFGELCWHSEREPFPSMESLEFYSLEWGRLLETLRARASQSKEFRPLGDVVHMEYQPFFDGNQVKTFAEECYRRGIELAESSSDMNWYTAATLNGEYYSNDDLILSAGKRALELVKNPNEYVWICFDENSNVTYNEDITNEALGLIKGMINEIEPDLIDTLREDLENNDMGDLDI